MPAWDSNVDQHFVRRVRLETGRWYADMPRYPGVWGVGDSEIAAIDECLSVWREWRTL